MNSAAVFIVDDDVAVRDSLSMLCEADGLTVECYDSAEAFLRTYRAEQPGCLVLDVRMGRMSGPDLHAELTRRGCRLAIIYLTGHGDIPLTVRAMKAGAVNFLTKPVNGAELLQSIRMALRESERLSSQIAANLSAAAQIASLTEREREVMALAVEGMHNKEIARRLGISHRTVEIHKARIMHKTGANTLLDLARIAEAGGFRP